MIFWKSTTIQKNKDLKFNISIISFINDSLVYNDF